jgi:hypothetical protein
MVSTTEVPFNFDLDRMKKAVAGPSLRIPRGLAGAKQLRQFLRDHKALDAPSGYSAAEIARGLIHG